MSDGVRLYDAWAKCDDADAMNRLMEPLADNLKQQILASKGKGGAMLYEQETRVVRFLKGDGVLFVCFSAVNVSEDQAVAIAMEMEEVTDWGIDAFKSAVSRALGCEIGRVN